MPRLKGSDFTSPNRSAFIIDIKLLGPGVITVNATYIRKAILSMIPGMRIVLKSPTTASANAAGTSRSEM